MTHEAHENTVVLTWRYNRVEECYSSHLPCVNFIHEHMIRNLGLLQTKESIFNIQAEISNQSKCFFWILSIRIDRYPTPPFHHMFVNDFSLE